MGSGVRITYRFPVSGPQTVVLKVSGHCAAGSTSCSGTAGSEATGADAVIDLSRADLHDSLRAQVFAATDQRGADVILDPLGGDIFDAALRALAWRGRLVVIGFASGRIPSVKVNYLLVKNIEVSGLQVSDYRKRKPELMAQCMHEIFAMFEAGLLKPAATITRPLDAFAESLQDIVDRRISGRVVLLPNP